MSRFGCGTKIEVSIPSGWHHKLITVPCGSTSYTGGINQCNACAEKHTYSMPHEDEGDMEWYERNALEQEGE